MDSPTERDGDNTSTVLSDLKEHRHGKVEVRARRVAPAAIVTWERIVRRAKVGGCDENGRAARVTPSWVICTLNLKASTTAKAIVEKCCAESCCVHAIALAVEIPVPTCTA